MKELICERFIRSFNQDCLFAFKIFIDLVFKGKVFIILLCVNEIKWGNGEN